MRSLKALLLILSLGWAGHSAAQMTPDPTSWKYEVKKKSATEYQLIFHLKLEKGWHVYSLHPGGDGYEISPSFAFDDNAKVKLTDSIAERGTAVTTTMPGIDGKITYFAESVDYVQNVKITGKTTVAGKLQYQVCSNSICLPPKNKDFAFEIK